MDFKAQIEQARGLAERARLEHERATQALVDAVTRLGILTGGYHGISALEGVAGDATVEAGDSVAPPRQAAERDAAPESSPRRRASGPRAKKGWGKRRTDEIIRQHRDGIAREEIGQTAAASGDAIHDATLRNALRDLLGEGRIRQQGDRYFPLGAAGDLPELTDETIDEAEDGTDTSSE